METEGGCFYLKKIGNFLIQFLIRAVIGTGTIFFVNQFLTAYEVEHMVGLNLLSFLVSGMLGIPGVILLYGILFL